MLALAFAVLLTQADVRTATDTTFPKTYALVETIDYDGGFKLLRFLKYFDHWSECVAERDTHPLNFACVVASGTGEDL